MVIRSLISISLLGRYIAIARMRTMLAAKRPESAGCSKEHAKQNTLTHITIQTCVCARSGMLHHSTLAQEAGRNHQLLECVIHVSIDPCSMISLYLQWHVT